MARKVHDVELLGLHADCSVGLDDVLSLSGEKYSTVQSHSIFGQVCSASRLGNCLFILPKSLRHHPDGIFELALSTLTLTGFNLKVRSFLFTSSAFSCDFFLHSTATILS